MEDMNPSPMPNLYELPELNSGGTIRAFLDRPVSAESLDHAIMQMEVMRDAIRILWDTVFGERDEDTRVMAESIPPQETVMGDGFEMTGRANG